MKGFYLMDRGWMDDPVFQREPFCRRAAWAWLVEKACITEQRVRGPEGEIVLARGQMTYSTRYLAKAWGWSEPKVRRYLDAVRKAKKIDAATDAGQTVITICDYEKIQSPSKGADAATDARATQDRRTTDANNKEAKEAKESNAATASGEGGGLAKLARRLCAAAGIEMPDPGRHWGKHKDVLDLVTGWVDAGAAGDDMETLIAARMSAGSSKPKSLRYFDGAVRDMLSAGSSNKTKDIDVLPVIKPLTPVDENALRDALASLMGEQAWAHWGPRTDFQCQYDGRGRTLLVSCKVPLHVMSTSWAGKIRDVAAQVGFDQVQAFAAASTPSVEAPQANPSTHTTTNGVTSPHVKKDDPGTTIRRPTSASHEGAIQ